MCEEKGSIQNVTSKILLKVTSKEGEALLKSQKEELHNRPMPMEFLYEYIMKF